MTLINTDYLKKNNNPIQQIKQLCPRLAPARRTEIIPEIICVLQFFKMKWKKPQKYLHFDQKVFILNSIHLNTKKYKLYKMLTKSQLKIMKLFVSKITSRFSLRQVGKELCMHQALAYRSCRELIDRKLIILDDDKYVLNYKENHQELAYFEHLRAKETLNKNKSISLLRDDIIKEFPYGYFVALIFGSTVNNSKPKDLDLLIIIENTKDIAQAEKYLYNITRNHTLPLHSLIISFESVYEMLAPREDKNIMTEVLNKHLILYGAELFYKLIKKGRE